VARWGKDSPITVAGAAPDFELNQAKLGTGFPINPLLVGTFNAAKCIDKAVALSIRVF
jgi:hypothetical protein